MPERWRFPRVGDIVLYVPDCEGDRCEHPPIFDRAAIITKVHPDGTVSLAVFHPGSFADVHNVRHGGADQLRTWYHRDEVAP